MPDFSGRQRLYFCIAASMALQAEAGSPVGHSSTSKAIRSPAEPMQVSQVRKELMFLCSYSPVHSLFFDKQSLENQQPDNTS